MRIARTRRGRRSALAALGVAAGLVLAGCGTPEAGAAAVVGDRRIPVSSVQDAYRDVVAVVGPDQQVSQGQILNLLILEPYLTSAAAQQGRGVSPSDARLDLRAAANGKDPQMTSAGLDVWRANLAITALQNGASQEQVQATFTKIGQEIKAEGVRINPRYGSGLDFEDFTIVEEQPNWLKATASPSVAPSPPAEPAPAEPAPTEPAPAQPAPTEPGATPSP